MNILSGYKTYIFAVLVVIISILYGFKVIDQTTFLTLVGVFAGLGGVAARYAIAKSVK